MTFVEIKYNLIGWESSHYLSKETYHFFRATPTNIWKQAVCAEKKKVVDHRKCFI